MVLVGGALRVARADDQAYLSDAEAPRAVFPDADRFERRDVRSTPELRERIGKRLGKMKPTIWESSYAIVDAFSADRQLGRAIEVEEIGKHRPITLEVGIDPQGKVAGVAVRVYREAYGGEIRSRRFLAQYHGKGRGDPLLPSQDIVNITGATLSARAVGRAVKKAIAALDEIGDGGSPSPAAAPPTPLTLERRVPARGGLVRVREAHYVMGTILEITVDAPAESTARRWIRQGVAEARRLDAELTSFRSDSALSRLNEQAGRGFRHVPPDLFHLVELSQSLSATTAGTFDITVAPLVRLWQRAAEDDRWPSPAEIAGARHEVGSDKVHLRAPDEIELAPGAGLEIGGVGKGYGADRIAARLRELGAEAALVNFGQSSIVAVGPPRDRPPWNVWVRRGATLDGPLVLRDIALSTSSSFGQDARVQDRPIGHIIDPRSGRPLSRRAQATALAPSGAEAEAWSKALLIDPQRAFTAIAGRGNVAGLLFDGRRSRQDTRFAAFGGSRIAKR